MREEARKIAEWLGWKNNKYGFFTPPDLDPNAPKYPCIPHYSTDDTAAITLLPVLVERGYWPELVYSRIDSEWTFILWRNEGPWICPVVDITKPTIAAAISSALTELIEKEGV